jgi:hypothetical protein
MIGRLISHFKRRKVSPRYEAPHGSIAILMFHPRVTVVPAAKLNINWISVGVIAEDGTSRYTYNNNIKG